MKFVAHRGASLIYQEDTLEALNEGARLGAYAVECDLRLTKDDTFVFFHDENLKRLANDERLVRDLTYDEMKNALAKASLVLTSLDDLINGYKGDSYVLFDLSNGTSKESKSKKYEIDDSFLEMVKRLPFKVILGVHDVKEAKNASRFFPPEQILAFMENESLYEEYCRAGAGIIRLWEQWLGRVLPADIKKKCPEAEVFIMSYSEKTGLDGNPESLELFKKTGVDGALLNDIKMALDWQKNN